MDYNHCLVNGYVLSAFMGLALFLAFEVLGGST